MEKFLNGIRKVMRRTPTKSNFAALRIAHKLAVREIIRDLRQKLTSTEIKHARNFLNNATGFNRKGISVIPEARRYDQALKMAIAGKANVLESIMASANRIKQRVDKEKLSQKPNGMLATNPAVHIYYATQSAKNFVERDDEPKYFKTIISESNLSSHAKRRLVRHLEAK